MEPITGILVFTAALLSFSTEIIKLIRERTDNNGNSDNDKD